MAIENPPVNPDDAPAPKRGRGRPRKERTPEELAALKPKDLPGARWQRDTYWAKSDQQDLEIRQGTRKRRSNIPIPEYWMNPRSTYQRPVPVTRDAFSSDRTYLNAKDKSELGHQHSWSVHEKINFLNQDLRDSHFRTIEVPNDGATTAKMRNHLATRQAQAEYASNGTHRFETVQASPGVFTMYKTPVDCAKCTG